MPAFQSWMAIPAALFATSHAFATLSDGGLQLCQGLQCEETRMMRLPRGKKFNDTFSHFSSAYKYE